MAKSSPIHRPNSPHPPSERDDDDGSLAPSDGVMPLPPPPPVPTQGGGLKAMHDNIPPTMEFDIDEYQAKRARSITIPN
eukprot:8799419-Karenia_brevis.AAC.1